MTAICHAKSMKLAEFSSLRMSRPFLTDRRLRPALITTVTIFAPSSHQVARCWSSNCAMTYCSFAIATCDAVR